MWLNCPVILSLVVNDEMRPGMLAKDRSWPAILSFCFE